MQSEDLPQDAVAVRLRAERRRLALGLLALLLTPALAACQDVQPGSGLETMRRLKERQPGGR